MKATTWKNREQSNSGCLQGGTGAGAEQANSQTSPKGLGAGLNFEQDMVDHFIFSKTTAYLVLKSQKQKLKRENKVYPPSPKYT